MCHLVNAPGNHQGKPGSWRKLRGNPIDLERRLIEFIPVVITCAVALCGKSNRAQSQIARLWFSGLPSGRYKPLSDNSLCELRGNGTFQALKPRLRTSSQIKQSFKMKSILSCQAPVFDANSPSGLGCNSPSLSVEQYDSHRKGDWNSFLADAKNSTFLFHRDYMDHHWDCYEDHSLLVFRHDRLAACSGKPVEVKAINHPRWPDVWRFGGSAHCPSSDGDNGGCFHALLATCIPGRLPSCSRKEIPWLFIIQFHAAKSILPVSS